MTVRKMEEKDIPTIIEFWYVMQEYNIKFDDRFYEITSKQDAIEWKKNYYKDIIKNPNYLTLVVENDAKKIVGYMVGVVLEREPFYKEPKIGRILEVIIDPNFQQKGFFKEAYVELINFLREKGVNLIDAEMDLENPALARYYTVNLYKRAFKLICWVKDTEEKFKKSEERKRKKVKK